MTTTDLSANTIRASRYRVPRTRGAMSGLLLIVLGAWAAIAPFIGPYFDFAYTPAPNDAWHWTAARGWFEVLPGGAAVLGGFLLLASASRVVTSLGGWLAAAAGAWLVIGPQLDRVITIDLGTPDPASSTRVQTLESLLFFYATGAAILLLAALALGRLSVLSLRDVQHAERRLAAEAEEQESPTAYLGEPSDVGRHGVPEDTAPPHGDTLVPGDGQPGYAPGTAYGPGGYPASGYPSGGYPASQGEPTYAHTAPPPPPQDENR